MSKVKGSFLFVTQGQFTMDFMAHIRLGKSRSRGILTLEKKKGITHDRRR